MPIMSYQIFVKVDIFSSESEIKFSSYRMIISHLVEVGCERSTSMLMLFSSQRLYWTLPGLLVSIAETVVL